MSIESFRGDHAFLSNFYVHPLVVGRHRYHSVEQYFQSRKCALREDWDAVMATSFPAQAKRVGRRVVLREDWEAVKLYVMRRALTCKFREDNPLGQRLIDTGHHALVEGNSWGDDYWGVTEDGGQNWLGFLLMARRAEVRAERVWQVTDVGVLSESGKRSDRSSQRRR